MEKISTDLGHRVVLKKDFKNYGTVVVLICDYREESGFFYGFAAHKNFKNAYQKALIELDRNYRVLKNYYKNKPVLEEYREKRVVHFSSELGFQEFARKVLNNASIVDGVKPELILDSEIPGPWTKWRRVWRVLFENQVPLDFQNLNVFMF